MGKTNPWEQILRGALNLACTAQRIPVLSIGEHILQDLLSPPWDTNAEKLKSTFVRVAKEEISQTDDYEFRRLVTVLEDCQLKDELKTIIDWGLASSDADVVDAAQEWLALDNEEGEIKFRRVHQIPNVHMSGFWEASLLNVELETMIIGRYDSHWDFKIRIFDDVPNTPYCEKEEERGNYWGGMLIDGLREEETRLYKALLEKISENSI